MRQERWQQVKRILEQALEKDPAERAPFLDEACRGDAELRRDVESLIALDRQAESFLETPVAPLNEKNVSFRKNQTGGAADMLDRLIGEVIDDKYRIEELLGHGGMGAVYKAVHIGTDRTVAVKIIIPQFTDNREFIERFKREAKAAGRLRHPNVVNVTDFGFAEIDEKQLAYLVMEYLDGFTLGDLMEKKGKLPLGFAVDVVEQTCLALNAAHKQGIVHRDLKPDNIWLEPNGRGGYNIKILDFGLAKIQQQNLQSSIEETGTASGQNWLSVKVGVATMSFEDAADSRFPTVQPVFTDDVDTQKINKKRSAEQKQAETCGEGLTKVGAILGTPLVMSPEQCKGEMLDARSDIYSLAVIVYAMLAGEMPFEGSSLLLIKQHADAPPPPLRTKNRDIQKPVADIVMSALAKDPKERPATALVFANRLRISAEGEPSIRLQASDLYNSRRSDFIRIFETTYLPFIILNILLITAGAFASAFPSPLPYIIHRGVLLVSVLIFLFAGSVNEAACALFVSQLRESPTGRAPIKPILIALARRLPLLAAAAVRYYFNIIIGALKFIIPGTRAFIDYSYFAPVVLAEEKRGSAALERSKELANDLRGLTIPFRLRNLAVNLSIPLFFQIAFVICCFLFELALASNDSVNAFPFIIMGVLLALIPILIVFLLIPKNSIELALLYFKARQAGGESFFDLPKQGVESRIPIERSVASLIRAFAPAAVLIAALVGRRMAADDYLLTAAINGFCNTAKASLAAGARADAIVNPFDDKYETTPLIIATSKGNAEIVKLLLENGADASAKIGNKTALTEAAASGRIDIVRLLLNKGADLKAADEFGFTAFEQAVGYGRSDVAKLLAEAGGHMDLMSATAIGDANIVKTLIASGADVNAKEQSGFHRTALMEAAYRDHIEIVTILIAAGADVNAKDIGGRTALLWASSSPKSSVEILKILLGKGADVNAKDNGGGTALIRAAGSGQIEAVDALLAAGADVSPKNSGGETALAAAKKNNLHAITMLLEAAGAKK